jgi:nicotinamidase-related amidase
MKDHHMSIDPKTTAVVLIEYQNDFTSDGGVLHPAVTEVMDKTGMLANTNLDFILRSKGITTIVLGGFLTNCCVESTMRSGYENGYQVITLSDCVAATSAEEHDNALRYDYPMFSQPMTSAEFIEAVG